MALDEPNDQDSVYEVDGFKYVVNKEFMEKVKPIKVEFLGTGFKVTSSVDFGGGCNSCSTEGTCCS